MQERLRNLKRLYAILDRLDRVQGGAKRLCECDGRMPWPRRGVYFFFEDGENRTDSGTGSRVVRVGTHALILKSQTTLWNRLSQHRGVRATGGGNHRGSIFRQHVGTALSTAQPALKCGSWAQGSSASAEVRRKEHALELRVTEVVGKMPFVWVAIDDVAGPNSERGYIERNAIGLLSNFRRPALDPPSSLWLGRFCTSARVRESGLWNSDHVDDPYDDKFLSRLERISR
jgi:hypothetical protein